MQPAPPSNRQKKQSSQMIWAWVFVGIVGIGLVYLAFKFGPYATKMYSGMGEANKQAQSIAPGGSKACLEFGIKEYSDKTSLGKKSEKFDSELVQVITSMTTFFNVCLSQAPDQKEYCKASLADAPGKYRKSKKNKWTGKFCKDLGYEAKHDGCNFAANLLIKQCRSNFL